MSGLAGMIAAAGAALGAPRGRAAPITLPGNLTTLHLLAVAAFGAGFGPSRWAGPGDDGQATIFMLKFNILMPQTLFGARAHPSHWTVLRQKN